MSMTPRERVESALRHVQPDRTPMFEYVLLSPLADAFLGRPYAADPSHWGEALDELGFEGTVRQSAIDRLDLACLLGHDMMYVWPNPRAGERDAGLHMPPAIPSDDPVERVKELAAAAAAAPAGPSDDALLVYVFLRQEMERRGVDLPILAPAYEHGLWTNVDLMMTMVLDPPVAHAHFRQATRRSLAAIEKYVELGIDQIGVGGDFAGNTLMVSPELYRAFIVPEVRVCADRVHRHGRWAVNASDGQLGPVLDDFLLGCGVDGYLEIDLHAGMDMRDLKRRYGRRITLYGSLDCGNVLSFASPREVESHTLDCLEAGRGQGGHILCASNAITASVPAENYLAALNAYRNFCGLEPFRPQ
ncbi:MAG TPA: uroporphyrinogen decarboxylase family protein [Phycisphaerae bacterium]|nr:uroporphyrinogen decarboxylase family protein [Phycisphaerae bacterium]HQL73622.1 uroporphyrinogen decarboxylase family protein [Phycisphaerae bacterium]